MVWGTYLEKNCPSSNGHIHVVAADMFKTKCVKPEMFKNDVYWAEAVGCEAKCTRLASFKLCEFIIFAELMFFILKNGRRQIPNNPTDLTSNLKTATFLPRVNR